MRSATVVMRKTIIHNLMLQSDTNFEHSFKKKFSFKSSTVCLTQGQLVCVSRTILQALQSKNLLTLKWPETLLQWKAETWRAGWRGEVLKPDWAGEFWAIKRHLAPLFPSSCLWLCTCGYVFFFFFLKCVFLYFLANAWGLHHLSLHEISWLRQFGQLF